MSAVDGLAAGPPAGSIAGADAPVQQQRDPAQQGRVVVVDRAALQPRRALPTGAGQLPPGGEDPVPVALRGARGLAVHLEQVWHYMLLDVGYTHIDFRRALGVLTPYL